MVGGGDHEKDLLRHDGFSRQFRVSAFQGCPGRCGRPRADRCGRQGRRRSGHRRGCGYQAITIEGVAERSGVAKSTIHRWWRSKPELVMEAYTALVARIVPEPDAGSLAADLTEFTRHLYVGVRQLPRERALRGLMAEA
ncbi:TetR/AcrR family transcriptional regulator [Streptomyces sp. R39]|uniref:TetR/AcrR family transcriptional regulator n=1 Tax=Streptomyces sp. R39 TaxID=3238631 RepID=A0AB39QGB7_9ACTN